MAYGHDKFYEIARGVGAEMVPKGSQDAKRLSNDAKTLTGLWGGPAGTTRPQFSNLTGFWGSLAGGILMPITILSRPTLVIVTAFMLLAVLLALVFLIG